MATPGKKKKNHENVSIRNGGVRPARVAKGLCARTTRRRNTGSGRENGSRAGVPCTGLYTLVPAYPYLSPPTRTLCRTNGRYKSKRGRPSLISSTRHSTGRVRLRRKAGGARGCTGFWRSALFRRSPTLHRGVRTQISVSVRNTRNDS